MPSDVSPAELRALELLTARQDGPGESHGHRRPGAEVPRAADDLTRLGLADVDPTELQAVGIRMLARLDDVPDEEAAEITVIVGNAAMEDTLDLERRSGKSPHEHGAQREIERT